VPLRAQSGSERPRYKEAVLMKKLIRTGAIALCAGVLLVSTQVSPAAGEEIVFMSAD
jgi:hypothetical protein